MKANNKYIKDYDLPFLAERTKIEKAEKLEDKFHDKKRICYTHNKFKTSIKSWISIKKTRRIIKLNQTVWIKSYIDMNTDLGKKIKN